jgi:hypothetical protein
MEDLPEVPLVDGGVRRGREPATLADVDLFAVARRAQETMIGHHFHRADGALRSHWHRPWIPGHTHDDQPGGRYDPALEEGWTPAAVWPEPTATKTKRARRTKAELGPRPVVTLGPPVRVARYGPLDGKAACRCGRTFRHHEEVRYVYVNGVLRRAVHAGCVTSGR